MHALGREWTEMVEVEDPTGSAGGVPAPTGTVATSLLRNFGDSVDAVFATPQHMELDDD